jgi:hypothetical protein
VMIHHWLPCKCWVWLSWLCDSACSFLYTVNAHFLTGYFCVVEAFWNLKGCFSLNISLKYSISTNLLMRDLIILKEFYESNSSAWPDVWQDWVAKSAGING